MQPTREGFSGHETEYVLHICQYGLREGGRLSIPSQPALHYKPIPDDSFLAVFFSTLPSGAPLEEQYWSFVLEKASQSGTKHGKWAKHFWLTHKSTQDQVVSTQIHPQTFSVAVQTHEVAPEDIFPLSVVVHAQLPSASSNKLHCSDESAIIPMIS